MSRHSHASRALRLCGEASWASERQRAVAVGLGKEGSGARRAANLVDELAVLAHAAERLLRGQLRQSLLVAELLPQLRGQGGDLSAPATTSVPQQRSLAMIGLTQAGRKHLGQGRRRA